MPVKNIDECKEPADYSYCVCAVYSCGYSQPKRKNISKERLRNGTAEVDCSSMVSWCLFMSGWIPENPWFHTAIEREYLLENGFEMFEFGTRGLMRNDVLWRHGHTGIYIGDGLQAEALRTERHDAGYDGSTPGDQDGGETVVHGLTQDWEYVLRRIERPITKEFDDMTFLFTCDGVHANHVYLYDSLMVRRVGTYDQQEVVKEAYRKCTGTEIPMFHLAGGDHLIALVNSGPVT